MPERLLVLGGTEEARTLVETVVAQGKQSVILSLAGALGEKAEERFRSRMTGEPTPSLQIRVGGFGGAEGLARYIKEQSVDMLIDATHPFAATISLNAVKASQITATPLARYVRPPWVEKHPGRWLHASDLETAARMLALGSCAFLAVGRQSLGPFLTRTDCRFVIRTLLRPDDDISCSGVTFVDGLPGTSIEHEKQLLLTNRVDCVITKNSGARRAFHKVEAAGELDIPVIMIARPILPDCTLFSRLNALLSWVNSSH